jgi:DNA-binding CsgD family transcriptional regulator
MNKAAALARPPDACLCRFTLGNAQVEVHACSGKPRDGDWPDLLATFEHRGVHFLVRDMAAGGLAGDPLAGILTAREREIVRLVATGLRNKQIAHELHLSEYTVAAYLKHVSYKLQVRNRTAMVTRCSQLGELPPGELAGNARRGPLRD